MPGIVQNSIVALQDHCINNAPPKYHINEIVQATKNETPTAYEKSHCSRNIWLDDQYDIALLGVTYEKFKFSFSLFGVFLSQSVDDIELKLVSTKSTAT